MRGHNIETHARLVDAKPRLRGLAGGGYLAWARLTYTYAS